MSTILRVAAALFGAAIVLPAQTAAPAMPGAAMQLAAPSGRVFVDVPGDGLVWARGDDWKASFGAAGFTFVPFLGSRAPCNYPLSVQLSGARCGDTALGLEPSRQARRESTQRIVIDRGSVAEVFELSPGSVEQKFVFGSRIGTGDCSVTLQVATGLGATVHADGSLTFANELGGVRIGKATAVDATGATASVATTFADGTLVYTVPAAFVARATFPLTIDPVFVTLGLAQPPNGLDHLNPDIAYVDTFGGAYVAVVEEVWSATDHDVLVRAFDPDANLLDTDYVDVSTTTWLVPRIASNRSASQVLCVARVGTTGIRGRTVGWSALGGFPTLSVNAPIVISATGDGPDVGGDPEPGMPPPGNYCVCWTSPSGPGLYTIVHTDSTTSGVVFAALTGGGELAVSKSCGRIAGARQWAMAGEANVGGGSHDIHGCLIGDSGVMAAGPFLVASSADDETHPEVSSPTDPVAGTSYWMVVYQRQIPGSPPFTLPQNDIFGAIFTGAADVTGPVDLTALLNRPTSREQWNPCVDTDGGRFAVGFSELVSSLSLDVQPWLATVHLTGAQSIGVTAYPELTNAYVESDDHMLITSAHSGGAYSTRYAASWTASGAAGMAALASYYTGHTSLPPASYFAHALPGCGGLLLVASGLPALGETMQLDLVNPQGIPLFLVGQSVPPVALCSGCELGIDAASMSLFAQANITYTVPQDMSLIGTLVAVQGVDLFAPGGCPSSLLGFDFTLSDEIIIAFL